MDNVAFGEGTGGETGVAIVTSASSLFLGSPWNFSSLWMDDGKGFRGL